MCIFLIWVCIFYFFSVFAYLCIFCIRLHILHILHVCSWAHSVAITVCYERLSKSFGAWLNVKANNTQTGTVFQSPANCGSCWIVQNMKTACRVCSIRIWKAGDEQSLRYTWPAWPGVAGVPWPEPCTHFWQENFANLRALKYPILLLLVSDLSTDLCKFSPWLTRFSPWEHLIQF